MSTTDPIRLERRAGQRFEALTPLAVHFEQRLIPGFTQNLSARGIFFYAAVALPEGSLIELTFTMPSEITLGESMPVRCRGRVLRVTSPQINQRNGVAARLLSYEYLPTGDDGSALQFLRTSGESPAFTYPSR
jgi:hypothetical protein